MFQPRRVTASLALSAAVGVVLQLGACSARAPSASEAVGSPSVSASPSAAATESGLRPEGTILFLRTTGNDVHTYFTANADGTHERPVTEPGDYCCINRVSPDRSSILVLPGGQAPTPVTGGLVSMDGTEFTPLNLSDPTLNLVPEAWSPDGTQLAFEGWDNSDPSRTGIYIGGVPDVTEVVRITATSGVAHDVALDFSPDGEKLLFYRAVRGEPDFPIDIGGSLWVVNTDGTDAHQLETPPASWWARWSPDGEKILFVSERNQPAGAIYTIRPDGSRLTVVFEDRNGGFPIDPIWSPDGSQIMFMLDPISDRFKHPANALYVIQADGSGVTKLIDTPDFKSSPEWWSP